MRTAQQIADAAAKRAATRAANRANGTPSVRAQRAAKAAQKAAAAGQPFVPPPPSSSRRRRFSGHGAPKVVAPIFAPKPTYRALKLAALAQLESVFKQKLREQGITDDIRHSYATYEKIKATALGACANVAMQNEADTALRLATAALVKLAF